MEKQKKKKQKKKMSWNIIIFYMVSMVIGIIFGIVGEKYSENIFEGKDINPFAELFVPLIFLYIAFFIQIVIHEGGHLIFGFLSGYKFESFRVGSIVLVKTKEGYKVRKFYLGGTGGQCLMSPPEMKDGSCPYVLYNLGGILTNIITSVLALILYKSIKFGPYMSIFIVIFIAIGVICAFLNGIPIPMGGINNDGRNVLELRKSKTALRSFWIQMKINSLITKGIRVKDMDDELFIIPDNKDLENPFCADDAFAICGREVEKMNFKKAQEIGQDLLKNAKGLVPIHRYMLISEIIFCELVGNNNKEYINEMHTEEFNKFLKAADKYLSILRMKYAYSLLFNNDEEEAEKYLNKFEKLAKNYIHKSEVEGERELIEYVNKLYYK